MIRRRLLAVLFVLASVPAAAQPAARITDVNTDWEWIDLFGWSGRALASTGSVVYFDTDDGSHGVELWRTDGTPAGTRLLKDICPGACGSWADTLTFAEDGTFYFTADDGSHGIELWHSDGTEAGTRLVKDLVPGLVGGHSDFGGMAVVDGTLFFSAADRSLWASDGTAAGTRQVQAAPAPDFGWPLLGVAVGGSLVFDWGGNLWISDGTEAGTAPLSTVRSEALAGAYLQTSTGHLYFSGSDSTHGRELWRTDGTPGGTVRVKDIRAGTASSSPNHFQELGGLLYFMANDGANGRELWRTDGTAAGTVLVKDVVPGSGGLTSGPFHPLGSLLVFRVDDDLSGDQIWATDGTAAGTVKIKDMGSLLAANSSWAQLGGKLYFIANPFAGELAIWETDGTAAGTGLTVQLADTVSDWPTKQHGLAAAGSNLFLYARDEDGLALWQSDRTPAGSGPVSGVPRFASSFLVSGATGELESGRQSFAAHGDRLAFPLVGPTDRDELWITDSAGTGAAPILDFQRAPAGLVHWKGLTLFQSDEVWRTDGTPGGTFPLASTGHSLTPMEDAVFFVSFGELWKTDGTVAGTSRVVEVLVSSSPTFLTDVDGTLFFAAHDDAGQELWTSDGTAPGTVRVKDIAPGTGSSGPRGLADVGGKLFFGASTAATGYELWTSDGTEDGTALVMEIAPGPASGFIAGAPVAAAGPLYFFVADDGSGLELWRSDGTAPGTFRVKDIVPGPRGGEPWDLVRVRNRVYFTADDGVHGRELWVSDGTAAGTFLVADLRPGAESSVPQQLEAVGHLLLFSAHDGVHGRELWKSDGTAMGTVQVQEVAPGGLSSSPQNITAAGMNVYFAANDNTAGFELWSLPRAALGSTFADVPVGFWAWRWVEALAEAGVTGGCGGGNFCPDQPVTRAQAAVFLERADKGVAFTPPPATGTLFADVPQSFWAAAWIEQLAADGVTGGCGNGSFCPDVTLTRAQMAVFLLRMKRGADFVPPPATGTVFADVPAGFWAAAWIESLVAEGVTGGCGGGGGGNFCPDQPVTRAQMAVFLSATFDLPTP